MIDDYIDPGAIENFVSRALIDRHSGESFVHVKSLLRMVATTALTVLVTAQNAGAFEFRQHPAACEIGSPAWISYNSSATGAVNSSTTGHAQINCPVPQFTGMHSNQIKRINIHGYDASTVDQVWVTMRTVKFGAHGGAIIKEKGSGTSFRGNYTISLFPTGVSGSDFAYLEMWIYAAAGSSDSDRSTIRGIYYADFE